MVKTTSTGWITFLSCAFQAVLLATMALLLPLAPFACAVLSGQMRFLWRYAKTIEQSANSLRALYRADVIARNFERAFIERLLPAQVRQHRALHDGVQGDCTHCGQCCLDRHCVFLDWTAAGLSRCSIYNNRFWKLTSCGKYPIDSRSIAVYDCPSFKAIPVRVMRSVQDAGCKPARPPAR